MDSKKYPSVRHNNIVVQEISNELMIYDLNENKAFCLNETSSIVWQNCDGEKTPEELTKILEEKLGSKVNEELVWFTLDQLKKEKLIDYGTELTSPFLGMSRREVVKKVGLGTMIALPLISSLVAPTGASAASIACVAQSNNCTFFPVTNCCPGNACKSAGGFTRCCNPACFGTIANGTTAGTQNDGTSVACRNNLQARCCSCIISNASYVFDAPNNMCTGTCAATA